MLPWLDETIVARVPEPPSEAEGAFQLLVSTIDYSPYLGRLEPFVKVFGYG